jgi:hypothetical protein
VVSSKICNNDESSILKESYIYYCNSTDSSTNTIYPNTNTYYLLQKVLNVFLSSQVTNSDSDV